MTSVPYLRFCICDTPEDLKGICVTAIELDFKSKVSPNLSIGISVTVTALALIVFLIKYRWHIKHKLHLLFRNYRPFPDVEEDFEMVDRNCVIRFHAYRMLPVMTIQDVIEPGSLTIYNQT